MLEESSFEDARRWRIKAKQARYTAELMYRDKTKSRLLAIADRYDQLAEQAETGEAEKASAQRPRLV